MAGSFDASGKLNNLSSIRLLGAACCLLPLRVHDLPWVLLQLLSIAVFSSKNQNFKKKFRHLHGDLNLDEIKNAFRLLSVNRETNLMNLIRLKLDANLLQ